MTAQKTAAKEIIRALNFYNPVRCRRSHRNETNPTRLKVQIISFIKSAGKLGSCFTL